MKDTHETAEAGWEDVREYMPPYGAPQRLPAQTPANVTRLDLFRVAPKGTAPSTIDAAKAILATARDIVLLGGWCRKDREGAHDDGIFTVHPLDKRAKSWSIGGAMVRAIGNGMPVVRGSAEDIAWQALSYSIRDRHSAYSPAYFNDEIANSAEEVAAEFNAALSVLNERLLTLGFTVQGE